MHSGFFRQRNTHFTLLALFTLLLTSLSASANPLSGAIIKASPLDTIIEQYPAMMSQGIRDGLKQANGVNPVLAQTIGGVVSRAFSARDIRRQVENSLDQNMSREQLNKVLQWYESPLGERISKAESQASSPSVWKNVQAKVPELTKAYRDTNREALFPRFDKATRATESAVDTAVAVQLGLASAMSAFQGQKGQGVEQLRQQIESHRGELRRRMEQQVYGAYLYTYNDFTNTELKEYIAFMESDPGAKFTRVVTDSVQQAILKPVKTISGQMMQLLNPGN